MIDLDELEDLFDDLDFDGPNKQQLYDMYGIFLNDFSKNPVVINGKPLKYNSNRSKHPICPGKAQAFEHIITRESKYSGKRNFDFERANKIHWIRPILESAKDKRIKYFEEVNEEGENQLFYWYEEKMFAVIVREISPDYLLITAFSVDKEERFNFKKRYENYTKR
jgi:hypothetical protein